MKPEGKIIKKETEIKAYPRTHYKELMTYGYRIFYFKDVITHLVEYHYHDYYELSVILSCRNVTYVAQNREYNISPGDIILCNVFEPHYYKELDQDAYCERFNLGVDPTLLFQYSTKNVNALSVFQESENPSYPILRFDFGKLYKYYQLVELYQNIKEYKNEVMETALVQLLVAYLAADVTVRKEHDTGKINNIRLVAHLIEYINNNVEENLTLKQLAKETNYSVSHICSAFKNVTNKTIISYIREKRMERAIQYLSGDMPLSEVAEKVGFNNYSYFYKAFKKLYGISPAKYRLEKEENGGLP